MEQRGLNTTHQRAVRGDVDSIVDGTAGLHITLRANKEINKYPAKAHCQRVARTLGLEKSLIVLQGEKKQTFSNSDLFRRFRQDRYFYYLTGCNEPNCFATYDTDHDQLILWLPPINTGRVFYDGRGSTIEEALELYDIDDAFYITGGSSKNVLTTLMNGHHERGGKCLFMRSVGDLLDQPLRMKLKGQSQPGLLLRTVMDACRAIKDEYEIDLVRKANEISAEAHTSILKNLHALKSEPEVESVYSAVCIARGARDQSYDPICGSGPNASQLHYMTNGEKFGERQVLLVDAGADWQHYASDVTRTMPINPKHPGTWQSKEAEAVYRHVEKIQEECIAQLRPGKLFFEIALHSIHMAIDALIDLGILKGDHMDIFHSGVAMGIYPHGLGHHLGLEVHDLAPTIVGKGPVARFKDIQKVYDRFAESASQFAALHRSNDPARFSINPALHQSPSTAMEVPLAPGMIVTVEPGIYFNEWALKHMVFNDPERSKFVDKDVLKRYMHVGGVRIEDDILITKDGYENLTTAPKGKEMLNIIKEAAKDGK